jgi:hypothetical protein
MTGTACLPDTGRLPPILTGPRPPGAGRLNATMTGVGLELHPGKTRIVYCRDSSCRQPWDGSVPFDFLGYDYRPRDTMAQTAASPGSTSAGSGCSPASSPTDVSRGASTFIDRVHVKNVGANALALFWLCMPYPGEGMWVSGSPPGRVSVAQRRVAPCRAIRYLARNRREGFPGLRPAAPP